ncbi:MAG: hypothetical protein QOF58_6159 [Pseudonocardiales bacterium]|jgi:hypothetical protein|nr:hypothetical protein [Pseudonocardiales bacterium]
MRRGTNGTRDDGRFTGLTVFVAVFGFVLFVPPLLSLFDQGHQVLHVPVVWVYLFGAWAVVIALVAVLVRRSG